MMKLHMRKKFAAAVAAMMLSSFLVACGGGSAETDQTNPDAGSTTADLGLDENNRFTETRKITVEVYDRALPGGSDVADNFFSNFIKEGMLKDHNVEVTFQSVPRWTEVEELNNLLAAGDAPDIGVTYDYPSVLTYAQMGGIIDLYPLVTEHKDLLPDLYDLLGEENIFWNKNPETNELWAIESFRKNNAQTNLFVRQDWLDQLNLKTPTTADEFEKMLYAFQKNASKILGDDADKMIPYLVGYDSAYMASQLIVSQIPDAISDKDYYIDGYTERNESRDTTKDAYKILNKWYNDGLLWDEFALYKPGDPALDNNLKAGYTGVFELNWDYPFRNGEDSIDSNLKRMVGEDAKYVAIEPFLNDAGVPRKILTSTIDRKLFFPSTNTEPVASLLYLNWISKFENRLFLQIGEEGINHKKMENGAVEMQAVTGEKIMNSPSNIDYTITLNGLDLGDEALTIESTALNYPGVDPALVAESLKVALNEGVVKAHVNVGPILSEVGTGPALKDKRDTWLANSIVATPDKFDAVYDSGYQDFMSSGGQAIRDERRAGFEKFFNDAVNLPD